MKIHPVFIIFFGLFLVSIGLNITLWEQNRKLIYQIQRFEAGPARGLFIRPKIDEKQPLSDEEINNLIEEMLAKKLKERVV